jgi:hypothetical protein
MVRFHRYKFTTSDSTDPTPLDGQALQVDIVGRGQEGQYLTTVYNGSVYVQTLENIITTYYSVIGDLLPTLPVEIDVFAVFQMKLVNIVRNYVKAVYYAHKQAIAPGELIRLVAFYDKLAQFCEKFSKTTSPQLVKNVSEMRPEVLRQCNTALVANLSEQMLKLFNSDEPAMSAEMDLSDVSYSVGCCYSVLLRCCGCRRDPHEVWLEFRFPHDTYCNRPVESTHLHCFCVLWLLVLSIYLLPFDVTEAYRPGRFEHRRPGQPHQRAGPHAWRQCQ